nr:hypothetical protein L203_00069 [Cryptococcus depauperatus CBS 7841]
MTEKARLRAVSGRKGNKKTDDADVLRLKDNNGFRTACQQYPANAQQSSQALDAHTRLATRHASTRPTGFQIDSSGNAWSIQTRRKSKTGLATGRDHVSHTPSIHHFLIDTTRRVEPVLPFNLQT